MGFLTSASHRILYIIPKESWGYTNMCIVGCIYFVVVIKALEVTNVLRNIAWRASRRKVSLNSMDYRCLYDACRCQLGRWRMLASVMGTLVDLVCYSNRPFCILDHS